MAVPTGMQCLVMIPPLNLKMRRTLRRKTWQVVLEALASAACISCACFRPCMATLHVRQHWQMVVELHVCHVWRSIKAYVAKGAREGLEKQQVLSACVPQRLLFSTLPAPSF